MLARLVAKFAYRVIGEMAVMQDDDGEEPAVAERKCFGFELPSQSCPPPAGTPATSP